MECSALNAHLYRNNIVPSPSCICGGFENPYHFLFVCPKYTVAKNMFFPNNLTNYTTQDLLLGKEREPVSEKKDSGPYSQTKLKLHLDSYSNKVG